MNEFELIRRLTSQCVTNEAVVIGPGDDCAVVQSARRGDLILLKTDAVVEGVHFTKEAEPERIGHKALGRCLSDIAAMAGTPLHALVTLGLPAHFQASFVERLYRGLNALARHHGWWSRNQSSV